MCRSRNTKALASGLGRYIETSCFRVFRRYSTLHLRAARAKREKRCEQSMSRRQHVNVEFDPQVRLFHQAVLLHELITELTTNFLPQSGGLSLPHIPAMKR